MILKKPHLTIISKSLYLLFFGILLLTTSCQKESISEATPSDTTKKSTESTTNYDQFIFTKILGLPAAKMQDEQFKTVVERFKNQISSEQTDWFRQYFETVQIQRTKMTAQPRAIKVGGSISADTPEDYFGTEVVHQGDFMFVAAPGAAKVHIYHQRGGNYTPIQILDGPEGFGSAIAISRNWLAVTAIGAEDFTGEVFVYGKKGDTWELSQTLRPTEAGGFLFGRDIAMYGNRMALIQEGQNGANGIIVYKLDNSNWVQESKLVAGSSFWNLDMSSTRLVGNGFPNSNFLDSKVYVFEKTANGFVEEALLPLEGGILSRSIAIDGNTIMANTLVPENTIFVFSANAGSWQEETPILLDIPSDLFPSQRAILLQGNNLAISLPNFSDRDAVHFYNKDFRSWREVDRIEASEEIADSYQFGTSLSVTDRGKLVVGAVGGFCFCAEPMPVAAGRIFIY